MYQNREIGLSILFFDSVARYQFRNKIICDTTFLMFIPTLRTYRSINSSKWIRSYTPFWWHPHLVLMLTRLHLDQIGKPCSMEFSNFWIDMCKLSIILGILNFKQIEWLIVHHPNTAKKAWYFYNIPWNMFLMCWVTHTHCTKDTCLKITTLIKNLIFITYSNIIRMARWKRNKKRGQKS